MATINAVVTMPQDNLRVFTYSTVVNGNDGAPIPALYDDYSDRSVQVLGTFGAGGNARIEGSNDGGTTYATLRAPDSTALDLTAASLKQILEVTLLTRPRITAGDGTTSITIIIVCRRPRSGKQEN